MMALKTFLALYPLLTISVLASQLVWPPAPSNVIWDGRIPWWFDVEDFDSGTLSPFNQTHVHGNIASFMKCGKLKGLGTHILAGYRNWSDYLRLPSVKRTLFDFEVGSKPLEVTVE